MSPLIETDLQARSLRGRAPHLSECLAIQPACILHNVLEDTVRTLVRRGKRLAALAKCKVCADACHCLLPIARAFAWMGTSR